MATNPNANEHVSGQHARRLPQIESQVHLPGRWLMWLVGGLFLSAGIFGVSFAELIVNPGNSVWFVRVFFALFSLLGTLALVAAIQSSLQPAYVRHAAAEVLADVPREPLALKRTAVHQNVIHELVACADGWRYQRRRHWWHNGNLFLWSAGLAGFLLTTALATWFFHRQMHSWLAAAVIGALLTIFVGAPILWLIGQGWRAALRSHCRLHIPTTGKVEFDAPGSIDLNSLNEMDFDWSSRVEGERLRLTIARETIAAVQLCPWHCPIWWGERSTQDYAVQGLLVVATDDERVYQRLPLLATNDQATAAVLMQQLADVLQVPYLFQADEAGWNAELKRAKNRKPQTAGGVQR